MKYFLLILIVNLYSCNENKRDFFQSLKTKHHFLDTFSLSNLKDFGISNKIVQKQNKGYYEFNNFNNAIYIGGFFRKEGRKLFFLPRDSEVELLFLDSHWITSSQVSSQKITTKSNSIYDIKWLGLIYDSNLKDSLFNIQIYGDGLFSHPENLLFKVNRAFDVSMIQHVDCRNDTLIMNFFPEQGVYFNHINESAVCL